MGADTRLVSTLKRWRAVKRPLANACPPNANKTPFAKPCTNRPARTCSTGRSNDTRLPNPLFHPNRNHSRNGVCEYPAWNCRCLPYARCSVTTLGTCRARNGPRPSKRPNPKPCIGVTVQTWRKASSRVACFRSRAQRPVNGFRTRTSAR